MGQVEYLKDAGSNGGDMCVSQANKKPTYVLKKKFLWKIFLLYYQVIQKENVVF